MRRIVRNSVMVLLVAMTIAGCQPKTGRRTLTILSTNDVHANIDMMPQLSQAIKECRDTSEVILLDAGDRWTGNAFVDLVESHRPIYELYNHLGYDVVTYGNHEFDTGVADLSQSDDLAQFKIVCANLQDEESNFDHVAPYYIIERAGLKVAVVGALNNYAGDGLPPGDKASYEGVSFSDPVATAGEYSYLSDESDLLVLLSHMGYDRDVQFAKGEGSEGFDMVIGGHSHDLVNEQVGDILITQTVNKLKNIGATTVTYNIGADGEVSDVEISYVNIPLRDYKPERKVAAMVKKYKSNPDLLKPISESDRDIPLAGLCNIFAKVVADASASDIGIYNVGGVRLDYLPKGGISVATVFNMEPFGSKISTMKMSVAQLEKFVMTKYNNLENSDEAQTLDIVMTVPYSIVTDENCMATSVKFPTLDTTKTYSVAMGDYVFANYKGLEYTDGKITELLVTDALIDFFEDWAPDQVSDRYIQSIE